MYVCPSAFFGGSGNINASSQLIGVDINQKVCGGGGGDSRQVTSQAAAASAEQNFDRKKRQNAQEEEQNMKERDTQRL